MSRLFRRTALAAALNVAAFATPVALGADVLEGGNTSEEGGSEWLNSTKNPVDPIAGDTPWQTDAIQVTARGTANDWPSALATDVVTYSEAIGAPSDFQDLYCAATCRRASCLCRAHLAR